MNAPAFDFYPERWTHGTRHMTKIERCDYIDLLCHQWTDDGLPDDLALIARLLGYTNAKGEGQSARIPHAVLEKFPICEDGKRRNTRLEQERAKQRERFERKSLGAAKTNAARWGKRPKSDVAMESLTDRLATHERVASESPPPTTDHRPVQTPKPPEPPAPPSLNGFELEAQEPEKPKTWEPCEDQIRVARWFRRRPKTPWNAKERKAWAKVNPTIEDIEMLEPYYEADMPEGRDYRRRDLYTLLNNWGGEIGKAQRFAEQSIAGGSCL